MLSRDAGPARLHQLNREHIAAAAVHEMAQLRSRLPSRLRYALALWDPAPMHASLFGSAARRTGDASSDIDILLVAPDEDIDDERWLAQVHGIREDIHRWTGEVQYVGGKTTANDVVSSQKWARVVVVFADSVLD